MVFWLLGMAFFFWCFVHEAFDGSARIGHRAQIAPVAAR
jgi:hypothetical protein